MPAIIKKNVVYAGGGSGSASSTEIINIDTGLSLEKSGNVCVLYFSGYAATLSGVIPIEYRPKKVTQCILRYNDGTGYYPALVTVSNHGTLGGNFMKNNDAVAFASTGILYGQAVWCIN